MYTQQSELFLKEVDVSAVHFYAIAGDDLLGQHCSIGSQSVSINSRIVLARLNQVIFFLKFCSAIQKSHRRSNVSKQFIAVKEEPT